MSSLQNLLSNMYLQRGRQYPPQPENSEPTECLGLNFSSSGPWWIPEGKTSDSFTCCNLCYQKIRDTCDLQFQRYDPRNGKCYCDSYLLKENIKKALFTVSLWSSDLKTHYPAINKDTVALPSNQKFRFLINANLPKNQYYRAVIKVDNKPITICTKSTDRILHKDSLLIKGTKCGSVDNQDFLFVDQGTMSEQIWNVVKEHKSSKITIEIYIYQEHIADYSQASNIDLGNFTVVKRGNNISTIFNKDQSEKQVRWVVSESFNPDKTNTPVSGTVLFKKDFKQINTKPLTIEVNLTAKGTIVDTDMNNNSLISTAINNHLAILRRRSERLNHSIKMHQSNILHLSAELTEENREKEDLEKLQGDLSVILEECRQLDIVRFEPIVSNPAHNESSGNDEDILEDDSDSGDEDSLDDGDTETSEDSSDDINEID